NSGRKVRTTPSALAAMAGSAIEWRVDLETAREEARKTRRPIFWYVPTIHRSPMDRQPEIDRYMLAGPFSWPRVTAFINEHFIPVRMAAGSEECKDHGLEQFTFVEPGWIVLDRKGKEIAREHQITTFHPARFLEPLARLAKQDNPAADGLPGALDDPAVSLWMAGVEAWGSSKDDEARAHWRTLTEEHAGHPLAWKAAMELEGHGPFVHAFETYAEVPAEALEPNPDGTQSLPGVYDEPAIWEHSARFLLASQRANGGWEDSTYDFGGTDSLPNVYVAVSAICTIGLLEYSARLDEPDPAIEAALERAFDYITAESKLNREDTDEQFWAHAYRSRCFTRWLELRPDNAERVRPALQSAIDDLIAIQGRSGAWSHEYANPFVTADALIALAHAKRLGIEPEKLPAIAEQGLSSLLLCRTSDGAYSYNQPRRGKARASIESSVGRTPLCELALTLWSAREANGLEKAVALSFEHEEHLLPAQKYDDHTSSYAYGGFFFYYDLHARTEAIAELPKGSLRKRSAKRQHDQLMGLPEFDGAFMDSHEIGRCYGTGMALWCLGTLNAIE
ncbi:MAG: hypothetical protein OSB57_02880, partial [Planctomycetota bacterium]|nr:hypothetical protein [Planctomycetota bacterium]